LGERGAEATPVLAKLLTDKSAPDYARWSAIWSLDRIEDGKAARDTVVSVLADPKENVSVRMQAARQLGTRQSRRSVPALVAALKDNNPALRFRAATALGRIGDVKSVGPLIDNLTDADLYARFATFTALNRIGKANPAAWEAIVKALSSDKPKIREGAAYAMRNTFDTQLVAELAESIKQSNSAPPGRAAAIAAIAPLFKQPKPWTGKWWGTQPVMSLPPALEIEWAGTADAQNAIRAALNDANPALRRAAIVALKTAPDQAAAERLVALFKSSDADIATRKDILRALAAIKSPVATPLAVEILGNAKGNAELLPDAMKLAAVLGGPQMLDALVGMLGADVPSELLASACETLGKMKDAKAVPALSTRVAHKDEKVATAATTALGQITGEASLKALLSILNDKRAAIRRTAALAIGAQKSQDAIAPLLAVYKDKDIAKEVITALAATPSLKALDAYLEGLASSDASLRSTCRRAIRSIQKEASQRSNRASTRIPRRRRPSASSSRRSRSPSPRKNAQASSGSSTPKRSPRRPTPTSPHPTRATRSAAGTCSAPRLSAASSATRPGPTAGATSARRSSASAANTTARSSSTRCSTPTSKSSTDTSRRSCGSRTATCNPASSAPRRTRRSPSSMRRRRR
jgi:HEAT repeat protein